jgi:hypothetical protein
LVVHRTGSTYLARIAQPKFGYGRVLNPCLDCRIEMYLAAKNLMEQRHADFIVTGEIAGQHPSCQMQHQLFLIQREAGLDGLVLRPLTAEVMPPTSMETEGTVNRKKLFGYTGRGRGHLVTLAHRLGIKKIPPRQIGCLLCEKSYSPRVLDLFKYEPNPSNWDADLLNAGRQIRISPTLKAVLARNEEHCHRLQQLFDRSDAKPAVLMIPETFQGPTALLVGTEAKDQIPLGGSSILRYTNPAKYDPSNAVVRVRDGSSEFLVTVSMPRTESAQVHSDHVKIR